MTRFARGGVVRWAPGFAIGVYWLATAGLCEKQN